MKQLTVTELAQWLADEQRPQPQLLDVREPWETQLCAIPNSLLVPMREVPTALARLDPERPVVCICHHGNRSAYVAMYLLQQGFRDVYNLAGGVDAWARQIDPAMPVY
ncbi:MAG: rhodanese-like domain-containing protein [Burkholderiaceae bacterium]|nr:rhodanese-like domain-containing protein [Burkholderiaceae bacterium]